jgi:hypothetical protein
MPKPLKGVGYELNSTNKGFSLSIDPPDYVEPGDGFGILLNLPPIPPIPYLPFPQFQCFAVPGTGTYAGQTKLSIVAGGVNYTNSNMPYIAEGVEQNFAQAFILKAAVLSTGVVAVPGAVPTTSLEPFMINNGFYALQNPANKYYVVLSYYDADGDPSALDVPILAERRPWISILEEGCTEFEKIFIEQGPSYYTGILNIAPMTEYDDAGDPKKYFGFNHTGYFNPTKFGANVKIIAMIENGLVTQYTNGGQNLTIPAHNHGTRMMYVPGMLEADDPYYVNEGSDWSYVVNTADITGLASVSYTGGWWDQVTDNTNPVAVTTHNYSYYSVNYEGTDNMGEFSCAVLGWPNEGTTSHRLRIKNGLVSFLTVTADEDNGLINNADHAYYNLRINEPNIYPEDTLHIGLNDNSDYIHNDGYIELTEGQDYYVFLFKVIPDWTGAAKNECKAPQLVISKVGDTPNTAIQLIDNGGGKLIHYYNKAGYAFPANAMGLTFAYPHEDTPEYDPYTIPNSDTTGGTPNELMVNFEGSDKYMVENYAGLGYAQPACYRKDIAHIKWDAINSRFIVKQLHTGPVIIEDRPITGLSREYTYEGDDGWQQNGGTESVDAIVGVTFTGYTKSLNDGTTNQPTGSTTANTYLPKQPSQIENPDIT